MNKEEATSLPKLTVITPSYNQGEFLEDTFRSVLDQKYPNLEYFVVDGGSTDNSVEIIKRYAHHFDWWVSEKDRGQSHAINKGLERATGDFVIWLNSDDFFHPGALDLVGRAAQANPDAGLIIGNGTVVDRAGRHVRRYSRTLAFDYDVLLRGSNFILQPSTFISRKVLAAEGLIDESLYYAMDLDYWLRVGNKYPVVTIDHELSAYRWYEDIKTAGGGVKRWVEMWQILQRHSKQPLTPGLLVEFFNILKEAEVRNSAGFSRLEQFAQSTFWSLYTEMQTILGTDDCIPRFNKGISFPTEPTSSGYTRHFIPQRSAPSQKTVVDVVLPAGHSWFVREGYVEALRKSGNLGRVFYIPSWSEDDQRTKELFDYLSAPQCEAIFLMDTMWHAQQVHATVEWQQRWAACPAKKIMFSFECMNNPTVRANARWWNDNLRAVENAVACVDGIVYAHEIDGGLFESHDLAALWQPFAVDPAIFPTPTPFAVRQARSFFKGKAERFYDDDNCYRERRELIEYLRQHAPNVDVVDQYSFSAETGVLERNQQFISEMSDYQIVVGLPSLSPTMVVRPFEAMLSGCVFFQNRIEGERSNQLFKDGEHFVLYDASKPEELVRKIDELLANPDLARRIAENGRREVLARHTIQHRVAEVLPWIEQQVTRKTATARVSSPTQPENPASVTAQVGEPSGANGRNKIVIDGVIFDLQRHGSHGISRVWTRWLEQIACSPLAKDIVLVDREGTAPVIKGLRRRPAKAFDFRHFEDDSLRMQRLCDEEGARLFISTYHTCTENTPCVMVLHDMIPELTGQDLTLAEWRTKAKAIEKCFAFFAVSQSTRNDFRNLYPQYADRPVILAPNAVGDEVNAAPTNAVERFKRKHDIRKPYFMLVGNRTLYKNAALFFRAFSLLPNREQFEIVCFGGARELEPVFRPSVRGVRCQVLRVPDDELSAAYSGAEALVYPSQYEGFGLPILEAQKCGCPAITCRNSSLGEVAGDSVLYVGESDVAGLQQALNEVRLPENRERLIRAGKQNIERFSWESTGAIVTEHLKELWDAAASLPRRANDPMHTHGRLIVSLECGDEEERQLATQLIGIVRHYRGLDKYDRKLITDIESQAAAYLNHLLPRILPTLADTEEWNNLLSYVLGLAAEGRRDWAQASALYTRALKDGRNEVIGPFHLRAGLRLSLVAQRAGNPQLARRVTSQIVEPIGRINRGIIDLDAERKLLSKWTQAKVKFTAAAQKPAPQPSQIESPATAKQNGTPLVSVLVSTYNSERFIRGCLEDLEQQTIADQLQIIVVDSASPQNEQSIVREFQRRYANIEYVLTDTREPVYAAWNRALRLAKGKYVTNANTDDRHRRDACEVMVRTLEANPDVALVYGDCLMTPVENETFESTRSSKTYRWLDFNPRDLLEKGCFVGPQPMWRRDVHETHGYFDESFKVAGDYEFWLRLASVHRFLHIHETLGLYLESPQSVEHAHQEVAVRESRLAQDRHREAILRATASQPTSANDPLPAPEKLGSLEEARTGLVKERWTRAVEALNVRPFHPEAWLLLADIAKQTGAINVARQCAEQAHAMSPGLKRAKKLVRDLPKSDGQTPEWMQLPTEIRNPQSAIRDRQEGRPHIDAAAQDSASLVLPHPNPLPKERELRMAATDACASESRNERPTSLPSPRGEGQGEGTGTIRSDREPQRIHRGQTAPAARLTVCLITKNEERFLDQCLRSVKPIAWQIVVVDTGSTDRTIEIAKSHGAEVHSFGWCDNFAAARNAALKHARGDWVLVLDADEELTAEGLEQLKQELADPKVMAYRLPIVDVGREEQGCNYVPRLFRNAPGVSFQGRIHEHAFGSLAPLWSAWGLECRLAKAQIRHHGYTTETTTDRAKVERNLRLLKLAVAEQPSDINLHMNLGLELNRAGQETEALTEYWQAFRMAERQPDGVSEELRETLLTQLCTRLLGRGQAAELLQVLDSPLAKRQPLTASLHYLRGLAANEKKHWDLAISCFRLCLKQRSLASHTPSLSEVLGTAPKQALAFSLAQSGQQAEAEKVLRELLAESPEHSGPVIALAKLLTATDRIVEALQLLNGALQKFPRDAGIWLAGGEIALSQPELLDFACDWTGEAIKHFPQHRSVVAQRAEALLLKGDATNALPVWQAALDETQPGHMAAVILCELCNDALGNRHLNGQMPAVSQHFLHWYQRLVRYQAHTPLLQVNERLAKLHAILPAAAQALEAALAEAETQTD